MGIPYVSFKLHIVFKMPGRQPSGSGTNNQVYVNKHFGL